MRSLKVMFILLTSIIFASNASAAIIDLYGDKDGFGTGVVDGGVFGPSYVSPSGDEGSTDTGLYTSYSWQHIYAVGDPILSASIEVFVGGIGAYGGVGQLFIDGNYVGDLTDTDTCGTGTCTNSAAIDTFDLSGFTSFLDGDTTFSIVSTYSGDFFALDYSELTIETAVPEPASLLMFGLGLLGFAVARRKSA